MDVTSIIVLPVYFINDSLRTKLVNSEKSHITSELIQNKCYSVL